MLLPNIHEKFTVPSPTRLQLPAKLLPAPAPDGAARAHIAFRATEHPKAPTRRCSRQTQATSKHPAPNPRLRQIQEQDAEFATTGSTYTQLARRSKRRQKG